MKKRTLILILAVLLLATAYATPGDASSDGMVKAHGVLAAVENDGTVMIDGKGYEMNSSARIRDFQNKQVRLDALSLPVAVYFEYEFTEQGPVIKLLRATPQ